MGLRDASASKNQIHLRIDIESNWNPHRIHPSRGCTGAPFRFIYLLFKKIVSKKTISKLFGACLSIGIRYRTKVPAKWKSIGSICILDILKKSPKIGQNREKPDFL